MTFTILHLVQSNIVRKQKLGWRHRAFNNRRSFCGMQDAEKVAIIKELALDIYVDDKPAVLETLHDVTTKVILKNQSYNQHVNLPRLYDWQEFQMMLTK